MKYTDTHRLKTWMNTDISNYLRKLFCLFLTVLFCLFQNLVWAAPQITGAPSSIQHKQNITISGLNFGVKENATPLIWEDFEDSPLDPDLDLESVSIASVPGDQRTGSVRNVTGNFIDPEWQCKAGTPGTATKWFCSIWYRLDPTWVWGGTGEPLANVKFWRVAGYPPEYINYVMAWHTGAGINKTIQGMEGTDDQGGGYIPMNPRTEITPGLWYHNEFEYCENSAPDVHDGQNRWWFNGKLEMNRHDVLTSSAQYPSRLKYVLILGIMNSWGHSAKYVWLDDVYMDTTWARAAIGDAPTWNACTHREMQIPVVWSANSITFTANQGAFADREQVYLYVVDENGNVNGQGYPVRFGAGQTLQGDVNQDSKVDIKDLILVAKDFGKTSGFNPGCDLNGDARVDIKDLIIVAKNFGKGR